MPVLLIDLDEMIVVFGFGWKHDTLQSVALRILVRVLLIALFGRNAFVDITRLILESNLITCTHLL